MTSSVGTLSESHNDWGKLHEREREREGERERGREREREGERGRERERERYIYIYIEREREFLGILGRDPRATTPLYKKPYTYYIAILPP